jgi:LDH2 family malate/lactate/ureidoglycolate dehydrogenase
MAAHLLWFDAAGASSFGTITLPGWLRRIDGGEFDLATEGKVTTERNGTAVIDGQNGLPPIVLERAAGVAVQKARDAGIGLVRVAHLGAAGPSAAVAAEMAIGPLAALVIGPGPSWSLAVPTEEGLPAVFDSALTVDEEGTPTAGPAWPVELAPWATVLVPDQGWLIAAISVASWESLTAFHARVKASLEGLGGSIGSGRLLPADWESRRRLVRDQGVPLPAAVRKELAPWAERLGVAPLAPAST